MTEPYRNADTRLKAAFAALRAEIEGVFGEQPEIGTANDIWDATPPALFVLELGQWESSLLDYAKQPASEG
jgi:hypothetical protein